MDKNYILYLLINTHNNYTYLGITNNSERRIRQHNGEIKNGANAHSELEIWYNDLKGLIVLEPLVSIGSVSFVALQGRDLIKDFDAEGVGGHATSSSL